MKTMTNAALEVACKQTVDGWDTQTLVQYAIDSIFLSAETFVVISGNGAYHASAPTEEEATEIAARASDGSSVFAVFKIVS